MSQVRRCAGPSNFVGITGTPGTGKKSIAPLLARLLGFPSVGLNDVAFAVGLSERKGHEEVAVDTAALRRALLAKRQTRSLVYGHLLPDVLHAGEVDRVLVLRCDPRELKRRLVRRGYSASKLRENLEAELIGVSAYECAAVYGRAAVMQFDTTHTTPETASRALARLLTDERSQRSMDIDWLPSYASAAKLTSLFAPERAGSALI